MRLLKNSVVVKSIKKELKIPNYTEEEKDELRVLMKHFELFARSYEYYIYLKLYKELKIHLKLDFDEGKYFDLASSYYDEYYEILDEVYSKYLDVKIYWENKNEFKEIKKGFDKLFKLINKHWIELNHLFKI